MYCTCVHAGGRERGGCKSDLEVGEMEGGGGCKSDLEVGEMEGGDVRVVWKWERWV